MMIIMVFQDENFIEILTLCKNTDNFYKPNKNTFEPICNVSKSDGKKISLIENSNYWLFNFDNICHNVCIKRNGHNKPLPASYDGLYYKYDNFHLSLFFIEFKNLPINSIDYKEELKIIYKELKNNSCDDVKESCPLTENLFSSLRKIQERYEDEIICNLKNKTTETLFIALPLIFKYFAEKSEINFDWELDSFISWLLKVEKKFIIVFYNDTKISPANNKFSIENRLRKKINQFQNIFNFKPIIVNKKRFEEDYLYKEFIEVKFPPCTSNDFIKVFK